MHNDILRFWFEEIDRKQWWSKDLAFDQALRLRFGEVHARAARCELFDWRVQAKGRLAEVIVLDQFSRNLFRDTPQAFANDPLALALAQEAIAHNVQAVLTPIEQVFLYMPFMHSESREIHQIAVKLFESTGMADNLDFELRHKQIIDRFGRYPHRNSLLGRVSTAAELEFLKEPGSRF
jgi:uncharacterized protein (DUF924 family)